MIGLIIIISDGGDEQDGFEILKELKQEICKKLKTTTE